MPKYSILTTTKAGKTTKKGQKSRKAQNSQVDENREGLKSSECTVDSDSSDMMEYTHTASGQTLKASQPRRGEQEVEEEVYDWQKDETVIQKVIVLTDSTERVGKIGAEAAEDAMHNESVDINGTLVMKQSSNASVVTQAMLETQEKVAMKFMDDMSQTQAPQDVESAGNELVNPAISQETDKLPEELDPWYMSPEEIAYARAIESQEGDDGMEDWFGLDDDFLCGKRQYRGDSSGRYY